MLQLRVEPSFFGSKVRDAETSRYLVELVSSQDLEVFQNDSLLLLSER